MSKKALRVKEAKEIKDATLAMVVARSIRQL